MNMKKILKRTKTQKTKTPVFDDGVKHEFKFYVRLGPGKIETIEFSLNPPSEDEGHLTYDHVEFAAMDEMDVKYPHDYYPKRDIDGYILIKNDEGKWSPIVSEGDKDGIKELQKSKEYDRFLVLPEATYSIAPEYALYMSMVENGMVDQNKVEYDYAKMHQMLQMLQKFDEKNDSKKNNERKVSNQ